jgi:CheY-like chemotaxis protein
MGAWSMAVKQDKSVLTTGEVAKWFDQGHLRGYRIPGSKDRRIPMEQLIRFMEANHIPLNGLGGGARVLLLGRDDSFTQTLAERLEQEGGYDVQAANSAIEAGFEMHAQQPRMLIVDVSLPDALPVAITRFIRGSADLKGTKVIGIGPDLSQGRGAALLQAGFDSFLSTPFEARSLIELIEHVIAIPATRGRG